jgi:hypothetical protein
MRMQVYEAWENPIIGTRFDHHCIFGQWWSLSADSLDDSIPNQYVPVDGGPIGLYNFAAKQ